MTRIAKTYITLIDGTEYCFPNPEDAKYPEIWEVAVTARRLNEKGEVGKFHSAHPSVVHVTRKILLDHGIIPTNPTEHGEGIVERPKSPEEFLLDLLESVGVFPQE